MYLRIQKTVFTINYITLNPTDKNFGIIIKRK